MKYFVRNEDRKDTNYHEFYKGHWDEDTMEFWSNESIYMHDDIMYQLNFGELILNVIPTFTPFGETEIDIYSWEIIYKKAKEDNGELHQMIEELNLWGQDTFAKHDVFTIIGI